MVAAHCPECQRLLISTQRSESQSELDDESLDELVEVLVEELDDADDPDFESVL